MDKSKLDYYLTYLDILSKLDRNRQIGESIENAIEIIEEELSELD
ncbi:hypothetical protein [Oceanobacillus profundus]|nr:hypothetical protein [Oceanobacillus profundus]